MTWKRRIRFMAMLTFVLLFFSLVYLQKSNASRVLVIHSYNTDYAWVEQINEGVARAFEDRPDVLLRNHYMDLKNHTDDAFRRTATSLAHRAVDDWQPDVLLIFDDVAQRLVGEHYAHHEEAEDPEVAIVFGGVNGEPEAYYGQVANVTGILERKPLAAIKETISALVGAQGAGTAATGPRIQYIGDRSASITAELPFYATQDWSPMVWLDPVQVDTFAAWQAAVLRANETADLILLTNYQQVREEAGGRFVRPAAQVMRWTEENASVPVLGVGWSNSQDGAMLTVSVSPFEQGEVAGRLALDILGGARPADLGVVTPKQFMVHMCARSLARRAGELPTFYEAFARATDNFYQDGC